MSEETLDLKTVRGRCLGEQSDEREPTMYMRRHGDEAVGEERAE